MRFTGRGGSQNTAPDLPQGEWVAEMHSARDAIDRGRIQMTEMKDAMLRMVVAVESGVASQAAQIALLQETVRLMSELGAEMVRMRLAVESHVGALESTSRHMEQVRAAVEEDVAERKAARAT